MASDSCGSYLLYNHPIQPLGKVIGQANSYLVIITLEN